MVTELHKNTSRGYANHGWLEARHTFSFAGYYNRARTHFGVLRVLNDDLVAPGRGFATHPHDNMEIISIPVTGALRHTDNMGNEGTIHAGEVQVMSAGTGVEHSEFNPLHDTTTNLLQIWVFPRELGVAPRYDQRAFPVEGRQNQWQTVVAPTDGESLMIHQDAWFSLAQLHPGNTLTYKRKRPENGLYLFVIDGNVTLGSETLSARDGLAITETDDITLASTTVSDVLLMDVPLALPAYMAPNRV